MVPILRPLLPATVSLEVTAAPGLISVSADAGQVEQALMNLVINARDALPSGGAIRVHTQQVLVDDASQTHPASAAPGTYGVLEVSDTGTGIPPELLQRIFEPHFTTKAPGRGTGLGLAVVESVLQVHGGFVQVESQPGHGTRFRTYFPSKGRPVEALARVVPASGGSAERVLVVDDEPAIRALLQRILAQAGYQVLSAENGKQALEALDAAGAVDLVLSDLVMPVMGGEALSEALRARGGPPLLVMSGYSPGNSAFPSILSKPFTPKELLEKVREVIARHRVRAA
jgi:CheY-like chemotaxis protein